MIISAETLFKEGPIYKFLVDVSWYGEVQLTPTITTIILLHLRTRTISSLCACGACHLA